MNETERGRNDRDAAEYMRRHEQSLLHILIERNYERAKQIIQRIAESEQRKMT